MNKLTLYGRLTKDPELKTLSSGTTVANFTIATSKKYNGEEKTQFHNCVAFGKTAENIEKYHGKGDAILVEGEVTYRSWDDKEGNKRYATEIVVHSFVFSMNNERKGGAKTNTNQSSANQGGSDDLPF